MKNLPFNPLDPWDSYPTIGLYMDQVLSIVNHQLASYLEDPGDRAMTSSMVNNYVKQGLLEAPVKKKYSREQVTRLVMIGILKQVMSMAQIGRLLDLLNAEHQGDQEALYGLLRDGLIRYYEKLWLNRESCQLSETGSAGYVLDLALISFLARFEASSNLESLGGKQEEKARKASHKSQRPGGSSL